MPKNAMQRSLDNDGDRGVDLAGSDGSSSAGGAAGLSGMSNTELETAIAALSQEKATRGATSGASSRCSQAHRAPSCTCAQRF
jgi:hypothetical protein